jgi:hypothetical protein
MKTKFYLVNFIWLVIGIIAEKIIKKFFHIKNLFNFVQTKLYEKHHHQSNVY